MEKRAGPFPKNFQGTLCIAVVMETPSGYGGREVDQVREREIISVTGSPNGSESVNGSQSVALPVARSRAIDWFSVGTWSGISEKEALKNCEKLWLRVSGSLVVCLNFSSLNRPRGRLDSL